jgi:hypothetical protein
MLATLALFDCTAAALLSMGKRMSEVPSDMSALPKAFCEQWLLLTIMSCCDGAVVRYERWLYYVNRDTHLLAWLSSALCWRRIPEIKCWVHGDKTRWSDRLKRAFQACVGERCDRFSHKREVFGQKQRLTLHTASQAKPAAPFHHHNATI